MCLSTTINSLLILGLTAVNLFKASAMAKIFAHFLWDFRSLTFYICLQKTVLSVFKPGSTSVPVRSSVTSSSWTTWITWPKQNFCPTLQLVASWPNQWVTATISTNHELSSPSRALSAANRLIRLSPARRLLVRKVFTAPLQFLVYLTTPENVIFLLSNNYQTRLSPQ